MLELLWPNLIVSLWPLIMPLFPLPPVKSLGVILYCSLLFEAPTKNIILPKCFHLCNIGHLTTHSTTTLIHLMVEYRMDLKSLLLTVTSVSFWSTHICIPSSTLRSSSSINLILAPAYLGFFSHVAPHLSNTVPQDIKTNPFKLACSNAIILV